MAPIPPRVTICVGDIHGHYEPLLALWRRLETKLGSETFARCTVIFLGDYNDRGPRSKDVYDWLTTLPARHPDQSHVFLCGNHDFSFAAFIGALPPTEPEGFDWTSTWRALQHEEEREGWWTGEGVEGVHVQGRRWGGSIRDKIVPRTGREYKGSTYDSRPTFESYGVEHGDREGLIAAVPESHKEFLRHRICFIYEQEGVDTGDPDTSYTRLVAVHAGLETDKALEPQLAMLRARDVTQPRLEAISGRKNVWGNHPELEKYGVLMVSGHHGVLDMQNMRLIIDESGGVEGRPLTAVILPSRIFIRHTDPLPEN